MNPLAITPYATPMSHRTQHVHPDGSPRFTNRLAGETSPYLVQHAHNPVDWQPWDATAFEDARQHDRPILLSVGYATCYWCHVMERESFESIPFSQIQNQHFTNIKVDREQRPDIDSLYMTATQIVTRQGGWPMNVFLTPPGAQGPDDPGLKPFFATMYHPPQSAHGRVAWPDLLTAVADAWQNRRDELLTQADELTQEIAAVLERDDTPDELTATPLQTATDHLLSMHDKQHGGFGGAPKFPTPTNLELLLHAAPDNAAAQHALHHTLDHMARGGVYDQVAGGFHRYSVDAQWLVPHFEKMLYDNAQLITFYTQAHAATPNEYARRQYERIVRETCDYLLREMTDDTGLFFSAQDAEVNGREGANYVWTPDQVRAAIPDAALADTACSIYGLSLGTNFQDPHHQNDPPTNVLWLPKPLHELEALGDLDTLLAQRQQINAQLKAQRDRREQPSTDDKCLTAWNGMAIEALSHAGRHFNQPAYLDAARRAADAIHDHLTDDQGQLLRVYRQGVANTPGFLEDHAHYARALLALHAASPDPRWLARAQHTIQQAIDHFAHPTGGYYDTKADQSDLILRWRSTYDGATPSANAILIHALLDLADATGDAACRARAERDLRAFSPRLHREAVSMTTMLTALHRVKPQTHPADTPQPLQALALFHEPLDDQHRATLRLSLAPGYHIDELRFTLTDATGWSLQLDAPKAAVRDTLDLPFTLIADEDALPNPTLLIHYQACTDQACLPSAVLRVELSAS